MDAHYEDHYIVDDLGAEVTGIAAPVTVCMMLTIALVRLLNAQGDSDGTAVVFAEAIYSEKVRAQQLSTATT
jgi:presenilin 1